MGRVLAKYAFITIGIYLVVENYKGSIGLTSATLNGVGGDVKAFQGR